MNANIEVQRDNIARLREAYPNADTISYDGYYRIVGDRDALDKGAPVFPRSDGKFELYGEFKHVLPYN